MRQMYVFESHFWQLFRASRSCLLSISSSRIFG